MSSYPRMAVNTTVAYGQLPYNGGGSTMGKSGTGNGGGAPAGAQATGYGGRGWGMGGRNSGRGCIFAASAYGEGIGSPYGDSVLSLLKIYGVVPLEVLAEDFHG